MTLSVECNNPRNVSTEIVERPPSIPHFPSSIMQFRLYLNTQTNISPERVETFTSIMTWFQMTMLTWSPVNITKHINKTPILGAHFSSILGILKETISQQHPASL